MSETKRVIGIGIEEIPPARRASGAYKPWIRSGSQLVISGQVSDHPRMSIKGIVGKDLGLEDGVLGARLCALNLIAQVLDAVAGDRGMVKRIQRVTGYVRCAGDFEDVSKIVDGCSQTLIDFFGSEVGSHARTSVGVCMLPRLCAVECDAMVEVMGCCDE